MTTSVHALAEAGHIRAKSDSLALSLARYAGLLLLACAPLGLMWSDPYWVNILAYAYLFGALAASWNVRRRGDPQCSVRTDLASRI